MNKVHKWSNFTGRENLQAIIDGISPLRDAMGELLNLDLIEVGEGTCVYEGTPQGKHLNPRGSVHGGWAMSILDAAAVLAVVTALPEGKLCATSTFEIKFVRPLAPGSFCRANGKLVSIGKTLAHSKARLVDVNSGKLIAFCSCSASLYDVED